MLCSMWSLVHYWLFNPSTLQPQQTTHKSLSNSVFSETWLLQKYQTKNPANTLMQKSFAAQLLLYSYSDTSKMQGATHCGTLSPNPINPFLRLKNILLRTCALISVLLVKLLSQNFLLNTPHFKKLSALNMPTQISSTKLRFDTTLDNNVEPSCLNLSGHTTNNTMQWKLLKAKWAHRTVIWNHISEACCTNTN